MLPLRFRDVPGLWSALAGTQAGQVCTTISNPGTWVNKCHRVQYILQGDFFCLGNLAPNTWPITFLTATYTGEAIIRGCLLLFLPQLEEALGNMPATTNAILEARCYTEALTTPAHCRPIACHCCCCEKSDAEHAFLDFFFPSWTDTCDSSSEAKSSKVLIKKM